MVAKRLDELEKREMVGLYGELIGQGAIRILGMGRPMHSYTRGGELEPRVSTSPIQGRFCQAGQGLKVNFLKRRNRPHAVNCTACLVGGVRLVQWRCFWDEFLVTNRIFVKPAGTFISIGNQSMGQVVRARHFPRVWPFQVLRSVTFGSREGVN